MNKLSKTVSKSIVQKLRIMISLIDIQCFHNFFPTQYYIFSLLNLYSPTSNRNVEKNCFFIEWVTKIRFKPQSLILIL